MAINQQEFEGLDAKKHKIVDDQGRSWNVVRVLNNNGGDVPGKKEVWLSLPGEIPSPYGWQGGKIIDEEWGADINLNHENAHVENL